MNKRDFRFISEGKFSMKDKIKELIRTGVKFIDKDNVYIGPDVEIGKGTIVHPVVELLGKTRIGENCEVGIRSRIKNSKIGDSCQVGPHTDIDNSVINPSAEVAHCEIVRSFIGKRTKIKHSSYVGDATIHRDCNVGACVVFGNYDGNEKHRVIVEQGVFIGINVSIINSKTKRIGSHAMIGADTLVKEEVPPGVIVVRKLNKLEVIGLSRRTKDGWETTKLPEENEQKKPEAE